mgnify:CR=1 FL=1|tara:strand:- start:978 stop:1358 length:381 start_codon:yes stop_codon:yes gene_type:complete
MVSTTYSRDKAEQKKLEKELLLTRREAIREERKAVDKAIGHRMGELTGVRYSPRVKYFKDYELSGWKERRKKLRVMSDEDWYKNVDKVIAWEEAPKRRLGGRRVTPRTKTVRTTPKRAGGRRAARR